MRRLLLGLFVVVNLACVTTTTPIVTPQPPPPPRIVQVTVRGTDGHAPASAVVTISDDTPIVMPCVLAGIDRFSCLVDKRIPFGAVGFHIDIDATDYDHYHHDFLYTGFSQNLEDALLVETNKPLPRIVAAGDHLRQSNGNRFTVIENTDFNLFGRFEAGNDVNAILAQRHQIGFNTLRVFTAYDVCADGNGCQPIGRLNPAEHPGYCDDLRLFARLANRYGLYVEYVGFTGPYGTFFANDDDKVNHWERLITCTADSTNVLLEMVNEWDHPANKDIPLDRLRRPPAPIFASHGSATQDGPLLFPMWDYVTTHYAGVRKAAHNPLEDVMWVYGLPATANETQRFPDNDDRPYHAYDMARGCVALTAGCDFHSVEGKNSALFDGLTLEAATEFVRGAKSVDLAYQDGDYHHRTDLETAETERVYSVTLAGYPELILPMRY